jgi:hypothetical protein
MAPVVIKATKSTSLEQFYFSSRNLVDKCPITVPPSTKMSIAAKKAAPVVKTTILGGKRQRGQEESGGSTSGTKGEDDADCTTPQCNNVAVKLLGPDERSDVGPDEQLRCY